MDDSCIEFTSESLLYIFHPTFLVKTEQELHENQQTSSNLMKTCGEMRAKLFSGPTKPSLSLGQNLKIITRSISDQLTAINNG